MSNAQARGWGPPGCTAAQLERIVVPGMLDAAPFFPLRIRREVAPLFEAMARWLVAERRRLGLPPLSSSGGYNKRRISGSNAWSNHSWGLAADWNAGANPHRRPLRTDMPPGTGAQAARLGLRWGADYSTPDPMHFEFLGTPADARRAVAALTARPVVQAAAVTPPEPAPLTPSRGPAMLIVLSPTDNRQFVCDVTSAEHISGPERGVLIAAGVPYVGPDHPAAQRKEFLERRGVTL